MRTVKADGSDSKYVSDQLLPQVKARLAHVTLYRHMAVLPGRGSARLGLAVSPFTEAKLYPSTNWEETFPCAVSLTEQSH